MFLRTSINVRYFATIAVLINYYFLADTLHISRRVRELLSIHNIGQRLFAKYILGLSQGTVSELLSKPKPWDKLTEKGRDSYRKMHAWACDENAIMLLKSLIPKKGRHFLFLNRYSDNHKFINFE